MKNHLVTMKIRENPLVAWLTGGAVTFAMMVGGVVWAVDARIEQKTHQQIKQLRVDVVKDFRNERIDFLQMKERAGIITSEEKIELEYLKER